LRGGNCVLPTFCICEIRGSGVRPAHKSLISNPRESRVPVVPTLALRASRPLVGNCTLSKVSFVEPYARAARGSSLLGKGPGHLMPAVAAIVMRCGRAFSSAAAARIVGDVRGRTLLTVYFGTPSMFITLWYGFDYGTNPPLGTLII
jgi:hypothetical protein